MFHARRALTTTFTLLAGLHLFACDGAGFGEERATTGTLQLSIRTVVAPEVQDTVWDVRVTAGDDLWAVRVGSAQYGDGAGELSYQGPCRLGVTNTVTATLVGVYDTPVSQRSEVGAPAPPGALDPGVEVEPIVREFECRAVDRTFIYLDATAVAPDPPLLDGPAVVLDQWLCAPKLGCSVDGDRATLALELVCAVPEGDLVRPDLALQELVLSCDDEVVATIDPTMTGALGDLSVSSSRARSTIAGGEVTRWSVALDVPEALLTSAECRLRAAGTACYHDPDPDGVSHGWFSGCFGGVLLAGVVRPYVLWDATVSRGGDLRCWNRDLGTDGLATMLPAYDATEDLLFPYLYWAW